MSLILPLEIEEPNLTTAEFKLHIEDQNIAVGLILGVSLKLFTFFYKN